MWCENAAQRNPATIFVAAPVTTGDRLRRLRQDQGSAYAEHAFPIGAARVHHHLGCRDARASALTSAFLINFGHSG